MDFIQDLQEGKQTSVQNKAQFWIQENWGFITKEQKSVSEKLLRSISLLRWPNRILEEGTPE